MISELSDRFSGGFRRLKEMFFYKVKDAKRSSYYLFGIKIFSHKKKNKRNTNKNALDKILNEVTNIRRYLMLKEVCPEFVQEVSPKIDFPKDEKGELFQNYVRYTLISSTECVETEYAFIFHWLNETATFCNIKKGNYQSSNLDWASYYEFAFKNCHGKTTASYLNNLDCLSKILITSDLCNKGKDFLNLLLPVLNKHQIPHTWCMAIGLCLLINDEERAKIILEKCLSLFPAKILRPYLSVANFAHHQGVKGFELESAVFNEITKNTREKICQKMIQGKTVALIGSGPQEKGGRLKGKIDAYDLVLRMNAYSLTDDYIQDHGQRCDIWYRTSAEYENERNLRIKGNPKISLIIPFLNFSYPSHLVKQFAKELDKGHIIQEISSQEFKSVLKKTNISFPSGGMLLASWLKQTNPAFSLSDCFAMALAKEAPPQNVWYRIDETKNPLPGHNLFYEWQQAHRLFKEIK